MGGLGFEGNFVYFELFSFFIYFDVENEDAL